MMIGDLNLLKWFDAAVSQHVYLQVAFVLEHLSASIACGCGDDVFVMNLLHVSLQSRARAQEF